jgi:hypothetical protein
VVVAASVVITVCRRRVNPDVIAARVNRVAAARRSWSQPAHCSTAARRW